MYGSDFCLWKGSFVLETSLDGCADGDDAFWNFGRGMIVRRRWVSRKVN